MNMKTMNDRTYKLVMAIMTALVVVAGAVVLIVTLINSCSETARGFC
jgi:hypothetical protein